MEQIKNNKDKQIKYLRKQSKMWEKNCELIGDKYIKLYVKHNKIKEFLHWWPLTIVVPIMLILILLGAFGII